MGIKLGGDPNTTFTKRIQILVQYSNGAKLSGSRMVPLIVENRDALCLRPTFEKLFTGVKVQHNLQKIGKTVYECHQFLQYFIL